MTQRAGRSDPARGTSSPGSNATSPGAAGLFAVREGRAMARGQAASWSTRTATPTSTSSPASRSPASATATPQYVAALTAQLERSRSAASPSSTRAELAGAARRSRAGRSDAHAALQRRRRSGRGGDPPRRRYTGKHEVIGFWGGFHGKTGGVLRPARASDFKHGLGPLPPGRYLAPYADCYRCPFALALRTAASPAPSSRAPVIKTKTTGADRRDHRRADAGHGRQRRAARRTSCRAVHAIAREHGALLIADEMITGFGRTGPLFGCKHDGVVPDIMTIGKGIGGGFPVSGVISTDTIIAAEPWSLPSASLVELRRQPAGRRGRARRARDHPRGGLVENAARVGRAMLARLGAEGEVRLRRRRAGQGAAARASSWSGIARPRSPWPRR